MGVYLSADALIGSASAFASRHFRHDFIADASWLGQEKVMLVSSILQLVLGLVLLFGPDLFQRLILEVRRIALKRLSADSSKGA